MTRPPTLLEAEDRRLLAEPETGVHTFSNGTEWDCWGSVNCHACWNYDADKLGGSCAFEGAAMLDMVSPELARMFGWTQDPKWDRPDDHRHGWDSPQRCTFFRPRKDDDGNDNPPLPEPDPRQLVLFADPTEIAAIFARGVRPNAYLSTEQKTSTNEAGR